MNQLNMLQIKTLPTDYAYFFGYHGEIKFFGDQNKAAAHLCDHIVTHPERRLWHALCLLIDPEFAQEPFWTDNEVAFRLAKDYWCGDTKAQETFAQLYHFYFATAVATIAYASTAELYCLDISTRRQKREQLLNRQSSQTLTQWAFFSPVLHKMTLSASHVHSLYFHSAGHSHLVHKSISIDQDRFEARKSDPLPRQSAQDVEQRNQARAGRKTYKGRKAAIQYAVSHDSAEEILYQHYKKRRTNVRKLMSDQLYKHHDKKLPPNSVIQTLYEFSQWQEEMKILTQSISNYYTP